MNELEEEYESIFWEVINKVVSDLKATNKEYQENVERCIALEEKYPKLGMICSEKKAVSLSVDEVRGLIEYLDCYETRGIIENKKILYEGARHAYFLLKKAGLLKDSIDE